MKMLLDENIPLKLRQDFGEYEVYTVQYMGWRGKKNGELLELILENDFDAFITFDKNIAYQQNFKKYSIPVFVLNAPLNSYRQLTLLSPKVKELIEVGEFVKGINVIQSDG